MPQDLVPRRSLHLSVAWLFRKDAESFQAGLVIPVIVHSRKSQILRTHGTQPCNRRCCGRVFSITVRRILWRHHEQNTYRCSALYFRHDGLPHDSNNDRNQYWNSSKLFKLVAAWIRNRMANRIYFLTLCWPNSIQTF